MGHPAYLYCVRSLSCTSYDHVKLGSISSVDPVKTLRGAYSRALGHIEILWLCPVADQFRDELERFHPWFCHRRVWGDREIFAWPSAADFRREIGEWEGVLDMVLDEEGSPRPARITDLENGNGLDDGERRDASDRKRKWKQVVAEAAAVGREKMQRSDLNYFIAAQCTTGGEEHVKAPDLKRALDAAQIKCHNIKGAMNARGFPCARKKFSGLATTVYMGLRLKQQS